MGAIFSKLRNFTTVPAPHMIRKYGIMVLLLLGVPKVAWDFWRIKNASSFKSTIDEDEIVDAPAHVLRLAAKKALKDMSDVWERVLVPHCSEFKTPMASLWKDVLASATKITEDAKKKEGPKKFKNLSQTYQPSSSMSYDDDDDDDDDDDEKEEVDNFDGGDDEAHDGFMNQWEETVMQTIVRPLHKVLEIKEEDAEMEEALRSSVKALLFMTDAALVTMRTQRRDNARKRYVKAQKSFADLKLDKTDKGYKDDEQEQLKRDLDRAKKMLSKFYDNSEEQNRHYIMVFTPKSFKSALTAFQTSHNLELTLFPEYEHYEHYREYRRRISIEEWRKTNYPSEWKKRIESEYMELACTARYVDIQCDLELGSIRKQRFVSLVNFVNKELCGGWRERALIVVSWALGSLSSLIQATEWHYRSTLLMECIEATLMRRRGGSSISSSAHPKLTLFDVCVSIFVLKATSGLIVDVTNKIQSLAFGTVRHGLQRRVAHTILSQDMEEAVGDPSKGRGNDAANIIRSLSDSDEWSYGVGAILLIPQQCIQTTTTILTTGLLLWGKSPRLLLLCAAADLLTKRLQDTMYTIKHSLSRWFGLDKNAWRGWVEMRSIEDAISNFEDMRINAKEVEIENHVVRTALLTENEEDRSNVVNEILKPFQDMINDLPTLVTAYVGGTIALGGGISAADLTNFTYQISSLVNTVQSFRKELENLYGMEDRRFEYGLKMMDLLDQKPKMGIDGGWQPKSSKSNDGENNGENNGENDSGEEKEKDKDKEKKTADGEDRREEELSGDLVFEDVSFRYRGMPKNMLKNVSFTIKSGSFVGICGERGAGKSTMYKLIMRLYDPNMGSISIGGKLLSYYNPVWLRSRIGISVQKPQIFRFKTLKENVLYGSEARFRKLGYGPIQTEKYIEKVLRKANIWKHFSDKEKFPQGLATRCYNLSGGETRSVGTARALLKQPAILLLDEPTEGLDAENEEKVMKNVVGDRPEGQTVLAIAHRLSSIKDADLIIFLGKDGKIAEMGSWEKLLSIPNGKFAKFESVQNLKRVSKGDMSDDDENENGGTSDGNGSEAGDSVSTDLSELSELSEQANPLERTLDAVEALRLYVKTSGMPRTVMSSLNRACNAVKEQQRVQQSMSSWGASWTPYKEAEDSTRIRKLRQKSHLRVTSRGGSMLKQTSVASSKNVHVSKHPPTGKKKNGLGLRSSSVF